MVKEKNDLFQCEACEMLYENKEMAEKCEAWCSKNNSCNVDIIKHVIKKNEKIVARK